MVPGICRRVGGQSRWPIASARELTVFSNGQHCLAGYTGVLVPGSLRVGTCGSLIVIRRQTTQETFKHVRPPPPPIFILLVIGHSLYT